MARAYSCDRCGDFIPGVPPYMALISKTRVREEIGGTQYNVANPYAAETEVWEKPKELCESCGDYIRRVIETPPPHAATGNG